MTSAAPPPTVTAADVEAAPGTREQKAARNVAARRFGGIPTRGYLLGHNDHSPMMRGIADLTTACYKVLDAIPAADLNGTLREEVENLQTILEDHRCQP